MVDILQTMLSNKCSFKSNPDSKVHGVLRAPDGPHVGPMNLAIRECFILRLQSH